MRPTLSFLLLFFTTIYISAQDTTPPILTSVAFSQSSVNAGETISVIVEAYDEMSPLDLIHVDISNSIGIPQLLHSVPLSSWTALGDHRYRYDFTVNEYEESGNWYVNQVRIYDIEGNNLLKNYSINDSPATVSITSTMPDTSPPTYTSIVFDPDTVEAGKTTSVIIEIQDDISGVDFSALDIRIVHSSGGREVILYSKLGNWTALENNQYSLSFALNEYVKSGNWYVNSVSMQDNAGNFLHKSYNPTANPAMLNVTSTTTPDATPPTLTDITFEPSTAQPGETVSVIVETQDDLSGVNEIQVKILNPKGRQQTLLSYPLSLWTEDGINRYRYDFTLDELALSGTWFVESVQIRDNANNIVFEFYYSNEVSPYTFEVEKSLSIENHKQQKLTVYPNPLESFIHINADFSIAKIYDLHGKLQFVFHSKTADVSALEKGFYILELFDDKKNKMATFKFIKK